MRCGNCLFWLQSKPDPAGRCHRHAPTMSTSHLFPRTLIDDWCGEFKPRPAEADTTPGATSDEDEENEPVKPSCEWLARTLLQNMGIDPPANLMQLTQLFAENRELQERLKKYERRYWPM